MSAIVLVESPRRIGSESLSKDWPVLESGVSTLKFCRIKILPKNAGTGWRWCNRVASRANRDINGTAHNVAGFTRFRTVTSVYKTTDFRMNLFPLRIYTRFFFSSGKNIIPIHMTSFFF